MFGFVEIGSNEHLKLEESEEIDPIEFVEQNDPHVDNPFESKVVNEASLQVPIFV